MNRVPLRSDSVQHCRSQRLRVQVRRTVHTHLYTAIRWRSVVLREEEFGLPAFSAGIERCRMSTRCSGKAGSIPLWLSSSHVWHFRRSMANVSNYRQRTCRPSVVRGSPHGLRPVGIALTKCGWPRRRESCLHPMHTRLSTRNAASRPCQRMSQSRQRRNSRSCRPCLVGFSLRGGERKSASGWRCDRPALRNREGLLR
jgi:hypothetical protein